MLSCTEISFVISFFLVLRNFESNRGFLLRNSIELILKTWRKNYFDMFYKNECWAVICYPICMTNVSYEREIIVLSFSVISFVILIFVFLRFEIKSGFPSFFFYSHCIHVHMFVLWNLMVLMVWNNKFNHIILYTGAKVRQEIYDAFNNIYPILKSFKKTS